eukprot:COSAG01_NODE_66312_length_270_cov_1.204678_1_plen_51_part_01
MQQDSSSSQQRGRAGRRRRAAGALPCMPGWLELLCASLDFTGTNKSISSFG